MHVYLKPPSPLKGDVLFIFHLRIMSSHLHCTHVLHIGIKSVHSLILCEFMPGVLHSLQLMQYVLLPLALDLAGHLRPGAVWADADGNQTTT